MEILTNLKQKQNSGKQLCLLSMPVLATSGLNGEACVYI